MSVTIGIIALTSLISLLSFSNNALKEQLIFSPYSHLNEKKMVVGHHTWIYSCRLPTSDFQHVCIVYFWW